MTYRISMLVAAATGLGLSVSTLPAYAANRQPQPGFLADISLAKMVMPMRRLLPGSHKGEPSNAASTVNTNNVDAAARFATDSPGKN